jgi:hypothetical protein
MIPAFRDPIIALQRQTLMLHLVAELIGQFDKYLLFSYYFLIYEVWAGEHRFKNNPASLNFTTFLKLNLLMYKREMIPTTPNHH